MSRGSGVTAGPYVERVSQPRASHDILSSRGAVRGRCGESGVEFDCS